MSVVVDCAAPRSTVTGHGLGGGRRIRWNEQRIRAGKAGAFLCGFSELNLGAGLVGALLPGELFRAPPSGSEEAAPPLPTLLGSVRLGC